jgi:2',3'-cyclic-nucleotide 2'-phosphodiesterase (5'-nucleotidase family)
MNALKWTATIAALGWASWAWAGPDTEAFGPAQAAADLLRAATGADAAFLPAGMLREKFDENNLASMLRFPTNGIAVVALTGSQVRQALERSIALYPSPNTSFLQLSGMTVTFAKSAAPDARIVSVTIAGGRLDSARTYQVAMPEPLAEGGLGYFKVWQPSQARRVLEGRTIESILQGQRATETAARWIAQ